jgi:predicted lactoylglutathione lyase
MILFQSVNQKICERWQFTISELCEFPQISCTVLYKIITIRLDHHKFWARWFPNMLTDTHKAQRMISALTCSEQYYKECDEFLNHIVRVGDETCVSFVNFETKQWSKQWMHTHPLNKPKSLNKHCLPERWCQLFPGTGRECWECSSGNKETQFTVMAEVYCETLKNCVRPFRTIGVECWHPV